MKEEVHALKSSAYRMGAAQLAVCCQDLEDNLTSSKIVSQIKELFEKVETEYLEAIEELEHIRSNPTPLADRWLQ